MRTRLTTGHRPVRIQSSICDNTTASSKEESL
ncbi:hypothetical protein BH10ACT8_BH10ACT8_01220 [soil metagenome]|jgi:hypothetical protein